MSFNVGLNIVEVDGRVAPSIQPAPTSVTGFSIKAQRGLHGEVFRVTNWSQFVAHFGSYIKKAYGAYVVRGFFDNGGTTAYITRVVNTEPGAASAASLTTSKGPWRLRPKDTLTINTDLPSPSLSITFEADPAELTGGSGPFDLSDSKLEEVLSLKVNGIDQTTPINKADFASENVAEVTLDEVVAVLNRIPGVQVSSEGPDEAEVLTIRTDRQGSDAKLEAYEHTASALKIAPLSSNGSGTVADISSVTSAEVVKMAVPHDSLDVTEDKGSVTFSHKETGSAHWIQVEAAASTATLVKAFDLDTDKHLGTNGDEAIAARASSHPFGTLTVTAGYRGTEDPGAWGDQIRISIAHNLEDPDNQLFDLTVSYLKDEVEAWTDLSMDRDSSRFAETVINDEQTGSKYVCVTVSGSGDELPPEVDADNPVPLSGGLEGVFASDVDEINAFSDSIALFDTQDIQLLCCPETDDASVATEALKHCQFWGDRMFVGHTPELYEAGASDSWIKGANIRGEKVYGAIYFPWIQVNDPIGSRKWIPPTGHVLGVYARTDRERGVWKAPAGNAAKVNGALDVKFHITDIDHTNLVKKCSINAVRALPGLGIVVDSSRTLSTSPLWLYVNVRLLFNFVKSSLKAGLRWVVQEPNDPTLWNKIKYNTVTPFLMGLWRRGAFGPGGPADVFDIKIDGENNSPDKIQQGVLTMEVYFYPSRPAETIIIIIGQQEGGGSASEG
jgi:hypothetical protein